MDLSKKWLADYVDLDIEDREFAEAITISGSQERLRKATAAQAEGKGWPVWFSPDTYSCLVDSQG